MAPPLEFKAQDADWSTDVISPQDLSPDEIAVWHALMDGNAKFHRAFYAPEFAQACARAHGRAQVLVIRHDDSPVAFFPFQFASRWQQMIGSAERIGGSICDYSGVIAKEGFSITADDLRMAAGLSDLFLNHLPDYQSEFGLLGHNPDIGHIITLPDGSERYLEDLRKAKKGLFQDTRRCFRKAGRELGELEFRFELKPTQEEVEEAIELKRRQYSRTGVDDIFADESSRLIINEILKHPSPHCAPMIASLRGGDKVIAWHLGLMSNNVLVYWFPVYDPEMRSYSPGRLLMMRMIEAAEEFDFNVIEMGLGDSQSKRDFSNYVQEFRELAVHGQGPRALAARTTRSLSWRLNALKQG